MRSIVTRMNQVAVSDTRSLFHTPEEMMSPFQLPMKPETELHIVPNEEHNRIEIHLRGPIGEPETIAEQLTMLYQYAETCSVCIIFINSPGGAISTLVELLAILKKFDTVITVGTGEMASAGFMLWCSGDIRVVQEYSSIMCHRESFGNLNAKTDSHLDLANYTALVYGTMVRDLCGDVLTDEEIDKIRYTEVYLTAEQLVDRGMAITWDQFIQADVDEVDIKEVVTLDGEEYTFISPSHIMRRIETEDGPKGLVVPYLQSLYGVPNPPYWLVELADLKNFS